MSHRPRFSQVIGRFQIEVFPSQQHKWAFYISIQSTKEPIMYGFCYDSSRDAWDEAQEEIDQLIMEDKSS